jgi:hypothetical protein
MFRSIAPISLFVLIAACSQPASQGTGSVSVSGLDSSLDSSKEAKVNFQLVDAPHDALKSVVVDIDHMEVVLAGAGKAGRLMLAQGLGVVDLLTLQNGISLPLQNIVAPAGLQIQQIRLILKSSGHYAVKSDDSICELKTPSAQKSGVKIILTNKVQFEAGNEYNIVVDFDALKSVVVQGNGNCLLKPVLKLKSATKKAIVPVPENPPSTGDGSGDVDTGGGEEIITVPDQNDPADDGFVDIIPVVDGVDFPVVTESDLDQLL